jgi:hypothetical protein
VRRVPKRFVVLVIEALSSIAAVGDTKTNFRAFAGKNWWYRSDLKKKPSERRSERNQSRSSRNAELAETGEIASPCGCDFYRERVKRV